MNSTKILLRWLAPLGMGLGVFIQTTSGSARVVTVGVGNGNQLKFFPAVTNIATGDQVVWVWNNTFSSHSTTDTGVWDSGLLAAGAFTNTFNSAGTFPYQCTLHGSFGMTGTVIVAAANNQPPTVTITNPADGAVFAVPANITIQAAATDPDGTITNVQFQVGSDVMANQLTSPFSAGTNNLAAGNYIFSAIAFDNQGATATNSVSISVVTPVPVVLGLPARSAGIDFQFSYTANAGLGYFVQRSTNLFSTNWITLVTNTAAGSLVNFSDPNATGNSGFYRVGRVPNP